MSLPTQLCACEEYCRREGYEVLECFKEEGESAKTTDRTELQNLLKYCRTHKGKVHFVVVYNLTRFAARSTTISRCAHSLNHWASHYDQPRSLLTTHRAES